MKINAIGVDYSAFRPGQIERTETSAPETTGGIGKIRFSAISFGKGNKDQAIVYGAELRPYQTVGGVSTVLEDMRTLRVSDNSPTMDDAFKATFNKWIPEDKVVVSALYNGMPIYDDKGIMTHVEVAKIPSGLPETSAFKKYEGKYFITNNKNFQTYANPLEFFQNEEKIIAATNKPNLAINKNIFILEDVTGGKRTMDFGGAGNTEIKLFRTLIEHEGKLKPSNDFLIFTDVTASWQRAYQGGGYASGAGPLAQSWKGDGDARAAKAFTLLMERICEVKSKDGKAFDPATVLLNDSQAAYVTEYMAEEAAKGGEFWKGKKPTLVVHNAGDGYVQKTSFMNMFVNIADKDLRGYIEHDPKFIEALKQGGNAVEQYFEKLIPQEMKDAQGAVSPYMNALYYAEHGFMPTVSTVSEGYFEKLISDPDFAPGSHDILKKLAAEGKFIGITNAFENTDMNPYGGIVPGYAKEYTFPDETTGVKKGTKIPGYVFFDKTKVNENTVDIAHVREIKRQNKISLFERLSKDSIDALEKLKDVKGHEYDMASTIAGLADKKVKVYGHIDQKLIDEVKKPNSDVKALTVWGRCDTQKALDSVMNAFKAYVEKNGAKDPNTVLIMGGEIPEGKDGDKIRKLIETLSNDSKLKGKFVYLDGFAPNKPLAMASDFAILPSRFAPCELTDLEAMKVFCSPIVTNCQGLAQKNFDATFPGEADKVTGYKTAHEYDMSMEDLRKSLSNEDREKLDKDVKKFKDKINNDYRIKHQGKNLSDAEIMDRIRKDGGLNYEYRYEILRPYRDKVIETELVGCMERALITDRNKDIQTKMVENHIKQSTKWENNGQLSKTGKASAQLYRLNHFQKDGKTITEKETLLYKLRQNCKDAIARAKAAGYDGKVKSGWFHINFSSKKAKIAAGVLAGAAALAGVGYAGYKSGWLSPQFTEEKKHGHLSRIA